MSLICAGLAELQTEHPAFAVRVAVDQLGLAFQRRVGGQHGAVNRAVDVGGGFHRFHHARAGASGQFTTHFRGFHKHHIAQGFLGVGGDADDDLVPSASRRTHSWLSLYFSSAGTWLMKVSPEDSVNQAIGLATRQGWPPQRARNAAHATPDMITGLCAPPKSPRMNVSGRQDRVGMVCRLTRC